MQTQYQYGSRLTTSDGKVRSLVDRFGNPVWSVRWNGNMLHRVIMHVPGQTTIELDGTIQPHPLFRRAQAITVDRRVCAYVAAIDWQQASSIPPVDAPAQLPPGTGSALLNWLSLSAQRAGRSALRYCGPYPTAALFDTLMHAFTVASPAQALTEFCAGVETRALCGSMEPVEVAFTPSPFEWHWTAPDICVQLRRGIERVFIGNRAYAREQRGIRRLRIDGDCTVAYLEIAGRAWHDVLRLDSHGSPVSQPQPPPPAPDRLCGKPLPEEVLALLGSVLAQRAPNMLRAAVERCLQSKVVVWGDTGDSLASVVDEQLHVHCVLGERLQELSAQESLYAFIDALEPLVFRAAQAYMSK